MKSILISIPVLTTSHPENSLCLMREKEFLEKNGYKVEVSYHMHESLISRGRCVIAHKFLNSDHDYLMCVDSDIVWQTGSIFKLINQDKLVVGGNYRHKTVIERWAGIPKDKYQAISLCEHVPTGFMLVKRDAFNKLIEYKQHHDDFNLETFNVSEYNNVYGFYIPYVENSIYLSEDWAFSKRLTKAGVKCYLDNMINLGHIGFKVY